MKSDKLTVDQTFRAIRECVLDPQLSPRAELTGNIQVKINMHLRALLAWPILLAVGSTSFASEPVNTIKCLVRYDDYTEYSDFSLEKELFAELDRVGAPVLLGVVPFAHVPYPAVASSATLSVANLRHEKVGLLKKLLARGHLEVAVHGFNHQANFTAENGPSEFSGLPFDRQRQLLALGRSALERTLGVSIRVFTPPFNAFDRATVKALEQTGFKVLSAGEQSVDEDAQIEFVPGTTYPQNFRQAVEDGLRNGSASNLIVVVLHPYDFVEDNEPMPEFRKNQKKLSVESFLENLRWAKRQMGIKFVSVDEVLAHGEELSAERVNSNVSLRKGWIRSHALLPSALEEVLPKGSLLSSYAAVRAWWLDLLLAACIYVPLFFATYLLSRQVNIRTLVGTFRRLQQVLLGICLGAAGVFSYVHGFYLLEAVAITLGLGWYAGVSQMPWWHLRGDSPVFANKLAVSPKPASRWP